MGTWGENIMAGVFNIIYTQEFTSTDTIQITHNGNLEYVKVKVVIDGESREDLISNVVTDVNDPTNKLTVYLVSAQTGIMQVFTTDFVAAGELSSTGIHGVVYTTGDQIISGDKSFTSTVGGIDPTADSHLITKGYLFDVLTGTASGIGEGSGFNTVFGSEFQYVQDDTISQTTSTAYQEKISVTISGATGSGIPSGDYRIGFSYEWRQSKQNNQFWARIVIDDTLTIFEREISPFVDVNFWNITTSFYYYPSLVSGTHTIDMDYKTSNSSSVSYIKNAKIEFWRVI